MRIWHNGAVSYVEGKVSEKIKIDTFINKMKELYPTHFDCCCDESEDDQICLLWGMKYHTQADRQEAAQYAKSQLKGK